MPDMDVSVVLAVKNEQLFVESAISSIARQPGLAQSCPNLRVFRNPTSGKCAAFNFGVSHAVGKFVCIFSGDDIMPAGSLAERWQAVKDYPASSPVVGLCRLVTLSDIKRYNGHLVPRRPGKGVLTGVSYMMNRPALEKIFPVPEQFPNEDTWMELAVTHFPGWTIVHSDIVGCAWRVHEGNSINMLVGFDDFNQRFTARMRARPLFYERYGPELTEDSRKKLLGLIACEKHRASGNVIGVFLSPVDVVAKLRALSLSNRSLYWLRNKLYGLFSGW
jgi:glycosyltransferase involved in cell wall biosynthesis